MRKPVEVTIPHRHTRAEAITRIRDGLERLRPQIAAYTTRVEDRWEGDRMEFSVAALGQTITGRIDVMDQSARIEVDLPWMLAALAGKVRDRIQKQGTKMLEGPRKA